jgi:hypothetical protein
MRLTRISRMALVLLLALTIAYDVTTRILLVARAAWWESSDLSGADSGDDRCAGSRPMTGPFRQESDREWAIAIPSLWQFSDGNNAKSGLHLTLCEDGIPLGPARSSPDTIRQMGGGGYLHSGADLLFSTSDGSDPNTNARHYAIRIAK